jgi:predicted acylesterase/phospholipase RssA
MGAEVVIAVDINPPNPPENAKPLSRLNLIDILAGTLTVLNCELTRRELAEAAPDILIRPAVGGVMALDFRRADRLVEIGRQAVEDASVRQRLRKFMD